MEVIIEKVDNCFRQTTTYRINGQKRIRRTNSMMRIESGLDSLSSNPCFIEVNNNDIKIVYSKNNILILKGYRQNIDTVLYRKVLDNIDENTPIIRKVKKNNKKLATLALTTVILASSIIGMTTSFDNQSLGTEYIKGVETSNYAKTDLPESKVEFEIIETPQLVSEDNFELEQRINQTYQLVNNQISNNSDIPISTKMNEYTINKIVNFIKSDDGKYFFQISSDFGIDPYTFLCLMMNESSLNHESTIPGGENYNGFGVGICQLETPSGQEVTAFNYNTNQYETIYETMENALDKRTNIKIGVMRYQNMLERYHGNEKLALQSYNFGHGLVDLIIQIYADEKGISFDDVVNNYEDTGWLKYVSQVSNDPIGFANSLDLNKYSNYNATIKYLKNWQYGNYGTSDYLKNLYGYYLGIYSSNIVNGNIVQTNLINNDVIKVSLSSLDNNDHIL